MKEHKYLVIILCCLFTFPATFSQVDPDTAQKASIDRFSMNAGHLFIRDNMNGLPGPNEPIDFDQGPFFTKGYGPNSELIAYYNFDVQSTTPAPIYVLFKEGESMPVQGQLNIIDVIPGDAGYNDFWEVNKVTVPADYAANTVTSYQAIMDSGYTVEKTTTVVNCPVVPEGSVARKRWNGSDFGLTRGWYKNKVVYYFNFAEKQLMSENDTIHVEGIYVSFNINPNQPGGGPPSGFKTDPRTGRAHNIAESIPTDNDYSPLWWVNIYDNADFDKVHDLMSAQSANILATGAAIVNCPVVAEYVRVDRFSMDAGHLFMRDTVNKFPMPNEPVDFDQVPFITKGLGPMGQHVSYYNFDIQPTAPAPIYVLFNSMTEAPVDGQHNIIDVIPGDAGYNDFWEVNKVMVPGGYVANSITSLQQIKDAGYMIEETKTLVNCPVVPEGSTAKLRYKKGEDAGLTWGWYKGKIVYYFNFSEKELMADQNNMVPESPIYVSFNKNPDQEGGGPSSGFMTDGTGRAHNVTATVPMDEGYSPMWSVNVYDNADFDKVHDLMSAQAANILATDIANVNCPIVSVSGVNPDTAQKASIDRFSMNAGHLFIRDNMNGLPGPNEPIDFDQGPFFTKGYGPNSELIAYYNFDVQSTTPAPIYVLFKEGESMPVQGQLNIIDVIPGDAGYNDFWEVNKVTVPADYAANTVTSYQAIMDSGYTVEKTTTVVNCPVVPEGSVARKRWNGSDFGLTRGWYKNKVVYYFNFAEKQLMSENDTIHVEGIYVSFNINPNQPGGGPPSGFKTDPRTGRAHNIAESIPTDNDYSPLWWVNIYDNADFDKVHDLMSAQSANILATGAAIVNCPVVAEYVRVDRFSMDAGHLFMRDTVNKFPMPNEPVDFDQVPFITKGLGPMGQHVSYYNFDIQPTAPAPIYVLFNSMTEAPVDGQHNIIDVIPGDAGYNDFWEVNKVMVPGGYVANSITSLQQIKDAGYMIEETKTLVNCPVVPEGSTAKLRYKKGEDAGLTWGWYKGKIVYYFNFSEKELMADQNNMVPESPIYVSFNKNPDQEGGGPSSGFMTDGTGRAHNVTATVPMDEGYSPMWSVNVYDNADFDKVHDLMSAQAANILATDIANVNCPVVSVESVTSVEDNNSILPTAYSLKQNYPNPFNPSTQIKFSVINDEHVSLKIYNSIGQEVAQLVNRVLPAGNYTVRWDAANFSSGVYFYTIHTDKFTSTKKMILLK